MGLYDHTIDYRQDQNGIPYAGWTGGQYVTLMGASILLVISPSLTDQPSLRWRLD